ncbi:DUF3034 family protein [Congregibacter litoralis]|uniref:DUF3034 family protein n=1 Tax=Congregibacter litoralis KT71 TaxID=314285 RepID=A4ACF0_9GAMM|nr:DUF3034 family protein [Congregibacter litoralis]EAQ96378.1 hypothetical protein KT71_13365 [Congregibacter litoralis KT71]
MQACKAATALLSVALTLASLTAVGDSKLLGTSGGQQIEGQAGGGIVPWALLAGYGDVGEMGVSAAATRVALDDFTLDVAGLAVSYHNRFELSYARQTLDVEPLGLEIQQDVIGAKLRLGGDLIYGKTPVITAGIQWKKNRDNTVPELLGATDDRGVDYTLSASRLWLDAFAGRNVFANATLRYTEANQTGLLGFGGPDGGPRVVAEGSLGVFLSRRWVVGAEYRQKPDQLDSVAEDAWADLFVGWFPGKRVSVIGAYTDLGDIAGLTDQRGFYLSLQFTH